MSTSPTTSTSSPSGTTSSSTLTSTTLTSTTLTGTTLTGTTLTGTTLTGTTSTSATSTSTPSALTGSFPHSGAEIWTIVVTPSHSAQSTVFGTAVASASSTLGSTSSTHEGLSRSNVGIIVGSVVAGMILGLLLAGIVWCCCRRRSRIKRQRMVAMGRPSSSDHGSYENPSSVQSAPMLQAGPAVWSNVRITNWLARMNSQRTGRSRATDFSSDPPEYKSQRTAPSDSASVYSHPTENPFGPGSYRTNEASRQADYLAYDLGHLKN
ncbi:hypothetical protein E1B28_000359 [Marasmius oreades]|uniref:Uncharacterized protein n=1 Tax=Marasmius oreades TaxID=181124 RepID=A0A9P8AEI2_9AGAR|nr:uncharacterized protein E1B28_000359 [Marasmius oreades]KAG7098400.1 hypothetical protein E1B28_000359 [Marasmius oreades]